MHPHTSETRSKCNVATRFLDIGVLSYFFIAVRMDTNERTNERTDGRTNGNFAFFSIFGGVLRTAAKNRKKCFETSYFAFFSIFGGVLRTAAKNRKKCFTKTFKKKNKGIGKNKIKFRKNRVGGETPSIFFQMGCWRCMYACIHVYSPQLCSVKIPRPSLRVGNWAVGRPTGLY